MLLVVLTMFFNFLLVSKNAEFNAEFKIYHVAWILIKYHVALRKKVLCFLIIMWTIARTWTNSQSFAQDCAELDIPRNSCGTRAITASKTRKKNTACVLKISCCALIFSLMTGHKIFHNMSKPLLALNSNFNNHWHKITRYVSFLL